MHEHNNSSFNDFSILCCENNAFKLSLRESIIIKELVKDFHGNFACLGENTEKYITFSVPLKKKIKNKDIEITYKIKFIDSYRFMSSSLSKLVDNLSGGIHRNKYVDCNSYLDYVKIKKKKLLLKCFNCNAY